MKEPPITRLVLGTLATNCWLIPLDGAAGFAEPEPAGSPASRRPCAVIDPGDQAQVIIARMERLHLYPRYILVTHGHFDHIAALPELAAAFAADKPEIAIHRDDASCLGPGAYQVHRRVFAAAGIAVPAELPAELPAEFPAPTRLLAEGAMAGPCKILHLPGHTPGSVGFLLEDAGVLFSGDTLFRNGVGRVDLPGGSGKQLQRSIERLFALNPALIVYPGHGPATTIGAEAASQLWEEDG